MTIPPLRYQRAAVAATLALLPAVAFAPVFGRTATAALANPGYVLPIAGAGGTVTATCLLLAATTRIAPVTRLAAAVGVLAAYIALAIAPGVALFSGPKRMLTSALPLDAAGPELATVAAVVGFAALGAVEPALRRRGALLPSLAPLVAITASCAVTASSGGPPRWLAPVVALGAAILLLLDPYARRSSPDRGLLSRLGAATAVAATLCVTLSAAAIGPALLATVSRADPADARSLVDQPVQPRYPTSPLVLFPALRSGASTFALTVRGEAPMERLRYATLDRFDGTYWSSATQYRRAGRLLPIEPITGPVTEHVERVTVDDPGPLAWLVSSGRPVEVSVSGLGIDEGTGDVVLPDDRPVPREYTVRSRVAQFDGDVLAHAVTVPGPDAASVPPDLGREAVRIAADADFGHPTLSRLSAHLAKDGGFTVDRSAKAPAGHGLYQVRALLRDRRGTAEQYASAFTLFARALGYDARIAVGFRPRKVADGYRVTGRDVDAWPEVRFTGLGWVPFQPTPSRVAGSAAGAAGNPEPTPSPTATPVQAPPPAGLPAQTAAPLPTATTAAVSHQALLATAAGLLVACATAALGLPPAVKAARRRRRRTAAEPDLRVAGAWRETVDRLTEAGVPVASSDTSGQIVTTVGVRVPEAVNPARLLAGLRDTAEYAPPGVTPSMADMAWLHADQIRRTVHAGLSPIQRLRATLTSRPLRHRS